MKYAPLVERIAGHGARAWDVHYIAQQRKDRGENVIVLSVGDPDFYTPAPIVEAAVDSLRNGRHHYTPSVGTPELRQAVAHYHQRTTSQAVTADNVAILQGAQNALMSVALCVLGQGDEVIVPEPMYVTYEGVIGACGANLVNVALRPEDGFQIDPMRIEAALTSNSRALLINTPHNPTGAVLRRDVVEELADICRRHDLWMISDEVYASITYDTPHVSPCSFPGMEDRTATISSLSKSHAMTGWRLGYFILDEKWVKTASFLNQNLMISASEFVQKAGTAALLESESDCLKMSLEFNERRKFVLGRLKEIGLDPKYTPTAAFYVFIKYPNQDVNSLDLAKDILEKAHVALTPGIDFGQRGEGFIRLSYANSLENLDKALNSLEQYFKPYL